MAFEIRNLEYKKIRSLLNIEKENPKLFTRKTTRVKTPEFKRIISAVGYTTAEKEQVELFMKALTQFIKDNEESTYGYSFIGLDIRKQDKYTLMFLSPKSKNDLLVVYTRARKREEIHIMYVPDYSRSTGRSTDKKKKFEEYIMNNKNEIEKTFDLPLYHSRQKVKEMDYLEITSQAWKGFSRVIVRDMSSWNNPDFIEIIGEELIQFIEKTNPFIKDFYREFNERVK